MAVRKAFLSSTGRDLAEYREAVCKAINGLDNWKCVRMEDFGARTQPAEIFDDEAVRDCDLFSASFAIAMEAFRRAKGHPIRKKSTRRRLPTIGHG